MHNTDKQFSKTGLRVEKWTPKSTSITANCSWPFFFLTGHLGLLCDYLEQQNISRSDLTN